MNTLPVRNARQALAAFGLAAATTLGVLLAMGALADRYHADEKLAQAAASSVQQVSTAALPSARG